jgi:hypothetical protein
MWALAALALLALAAGGGASAADGDAAADGAAAARLAEALAAHCGGGPCAAAHPDLGSAIVAAELVGAGAHRRLEYTVQLGCLERGADAADAAAAPAPRADCELALLQPLPAAVFADVYALDAAAVAGRGPRVRLFGAVDLEAVEARAAPTALAAYAAVEARPGALPGALDACGGAALAVALHARYPRPAAPPPGGGWRAALASPFVEVALPASALLARCGGGTWAAVPATARGPRAWRVPAGNLLHARVVPAATALAVLAAAAAIVFAPTGAASAPPRRSARRRVNN